MTPLPASAEQWPALSRLLDEALALPPAERDTWLAALGGDDARHRETLCELLATQAGIETNDFLQALPAMGSQAPADRLAAGAVVGPYRLIEPLGEGGMGVVWRAERADGTVKRSIALKLPRAVWGGAFAERLAREREILAGLEHEHIARLYDAGLDAQGRPYLAMALVEGEPIDAYCRTHSLGVPARVGLLLQAMAAVAHAHARLVVHRDLKPANILVDRDGRVKLLDFGVAKLLEGDSTHATALTELSGRALTLDYASPEQIRGEPLSTGSDVYSMGVVAYELLTGARPYRLKRRSAAELEEAIASAEAPLASAATEDRALRRQLRGDLDAILNQALKKRPEERYPTMDAFAQDIERWRNGAPVRARPDALSYRTRKFVGRYRLQVAAGTAVAVALVTGATVALWQAREARLEADRARSEAATSKAVRSFIESVFLTNTGNQDDAKRARETTASELLDRGAERIQRELAGQPEAQFELCGLMADMYAQMSLNERAAVVLRRRLVLGTRLYGADDRRTIGVSLALAKALLNMRRPDEARAVLHDAEAKVARLPGDTAEMRMTIAVALAGADLHTDPQRALVQARLAAAVARGRPATRATVETFQLLGELANITGHLEEAEAAFTETKDQIERHPETGREGLSWILASLGVVQDKLGRVDVAGATLQQAVALAARTDPFAQHMASYRLSSYQLNNGMLREALATAAANDEWGRSAGKAFNALLPVVLANLHARLLLAYGDPAKALAVVESMRENLGNLPPSTLASVFAVKAEALVALGRLPQADAELRRAAELVDDKAPPVELDMVRAARRRYWQATGQAPQALQSFRAGSAAVPSPLAAVRRQAEEAGLLWAAGRADEAQALATRVLAALEPLPGRRYAWQAEAQAADVLGRALLDAGDATAAARHLAQAVALREAHEDPQRSPALAEALLARAACHRAAGDPSAAAADTARARRMREVVGSP